jgi:hypothetical protein
VTHDHLGKVKNCGQGYIRNVTKDTIFGAPAASEKNAWNAAMCITGQPNESQLRPDKDLGTTNRIGCRNVVRRPEDANRAFGCPTIRTDIPQPGYKSVADH